jgi:hypothetical protein
LWNDGTFFLTESNPNEVERVIFTSASDEYSTRLLQRRNFPVRAILRTEKFPKENPRNQEP